MANLEIPLKIEHCLNVLIRDNYKDDPVREYEKTYIIVQAVKNELKDNGIQVFSEWYDEYTTKISEYDKGYLLYQAVKYEPKSKKSRYDINTIIELAKEFDENNTLKTDDEKEYDLKKIEFEETHFKCRDSFYHIYKNSLVQYTRNGLLTKYEHIKVGAEETTFLTEWLRDSNIKTYEAIDFLPPPLPYNDDTYNTWDLIPTQVIGDVDMDEANVDTSFLHKLLYKLSNSGDTSYEFLLNYLSHLVQYPSIKPEVGIFFTSTQGSGKDTFAKLISLIINENLLAFENDPDNIFGKYNLRTRLNKMVVILQEADNIKLYNSKIKDLITCKTATLADKGVKSITVQDYTRLMVFSNNENILKIEPDDRRWVIFKCWNFHVDKDPDFFKEVYNAMNNPDVINKFKQELFNRDIDGNYNFQKNRPITEIYEDLKQVNIPSIIKWASILTTDNLNTDEPLTSTEMCNHYNEFCKNNYDNNTAVSVQSFGLSVKKYFCINNNWKGFDKKHVKTGTVFVIDKNKLRDFISDTYNYTEEC